MNETVKKLIEEMVTLTEEQRVEIFRELKARYCQYCGRLEEAEDTQHGIHCQCWNDE